MNEQELRDLLKLQRSIVHFIERCLRTEQEKNEDRVKKQLEATGIEITADIYPNNAVLPEGFDF